MVTTPGGSGDNAASGRRSARQSRWLAGFYYVHIPFLLASAFLLDFELFTKLSLCYTTVVSAVTAGATYSARAKAADAEVASHEHP